jgi:hypothetical protein
MSTVDSIFLAVCILSLALMLIFSKVIRAIVWESLFHPFTRSRIELHDGYIKIWRVVSKEGDANEGETASSPPSPDKTLQWKEVPRG